MLVSVILVVCLTLEVLQAADLRKPSLYTIGFKDWKHATGKHGIFACHAYLHMQDVVSWNQYKFNLKQGTLILEQLTSARADQIEENPYQHYIKAVAEILLLCSKQDIAESQSNPQTGETLEICQLLAKHDPLYVTESVMPNGPKNATYTSPDIQNALLNVNA